MFVHTDCEPVSDWEIGRKLYEKNKTKSNVNSDECAHSTNSISNECNREKKTVKQNTHDIY